MLYAASMTFSGYDPQLLGRLRTSGASAPQIYLLQRVLRAIEPDALLANHTATLSGLAADLPRAQAAMESHAKRSQPNEKLLSCLCRNAESTVARSQLFEPNSQFLIDIMSVLSGVPPIVNGRPPVISKSICLSLAAQIDAPVQKVPAVIMNMFQKAWSLPSSVSVDWKYLEHVSDELACLLASSDRDRTTLDEQLAHALRLMQNPGNCG